MFRPYSLGQWVLGPPLFGTTAGVDLVPVPECVVIRKAKGREQNTG